MDRKYSWYIPGKDKALLYKQYKFIRNTLICYGVGLVWLMAAMVYYFTANLSGFGSSMSWLFLGIVPGMLISGGPIMQKLFGFGKQLGMFKDENPDYEIITTYSDGRKVSDGGATSSNAKKVDNIFMAIIMIIISFLVNFFYLVYMPIRYKKLYKKAGWIPDFKPGLRFFYVLFFIIVIAGGIINMSIYKNIVNKQFVGDNHQTNTPTAQLVNVDNSQYRKE